MRDLSHLAPHRIALEDFILVGMLGVFELPSPTDGRRLRVIASDNDGWDHVSVSRVNRCPNWPEMSFVAAQFFADDEFAMQLHVPAELHVNNHPFCLHWWRPHAQAVPVPPAWMVGVPGVSPERVEALIKQARQKGLTEATLAELEEELGLIRGG